MTTEQLDTFHRRMARVRTVDDVERLRAWLVKVRDEGSGPIHPADCFESLAMLQVALQAPDERPPE